MSRISAYLRTVPAFAAAKEIGYRWDDWAYTDYFYHDKPELLGVYSQLTGLGNRALCIALGEWIGQRLIAAPKYGVARDFFDAAWATMIRSDSCDYAELPQPDWAGILDGPLRAAMLIVNDAIFDAEEDFAFAERSCWSVNLARHILDESDRAPFEEWLASSTHRLLYAHSGPMFGYRSIFDRRFSFGDPVGPGVFILAETYDPAGAIEDISKLVNQQIGRNQYLRLASPL